MVELIDRDDTVRVAHQGCREFGSADYDPLGLYGRAMEKGRDGAVTCPACGYGTDASPLGYMVDGFDVSLTQWGLRGAPHAWRAMRERLAFVETPANPRDVEELVYRTFEELTGIDLRTETDEAVYTERFAHYGMSAGQQPIPWWRDEAIPLIVARATRPGAEAE